jgi:segregation and condensation protein B
MDELKHIIESLLFVSEDPLTVDQIRKVVKSADAGTVREAVAALKEEYEHRQGGFFLAEVAGGFQLRTRPEYNEYIKDLLQPSPPRLSKAALETLAIIAYKQPIIRADLEHIRGVDSGGVLRLLLKRKLIRVLGRKEIPGRPLIYATTKRFLEVFDLKDLKDLPTPKEIEELGSEASDELAAAFEALSIPEDGPSRPAAEPGLFDALPAKTDDAGHEPESGEPAPVQGPKRPAAAGNPDLPAEAGEEPGPPAGAEAAETAGQEDTAEEDRPQDPGFEEEPSATPDSDTTDDGEGPDNGEEEADWDSRF